MTTALATQQASSDEQMIALWLFGRSPRTQRAYRAHNCAPDARCKAVSKASRI